MSQNLFPSYLGVLLLALAVPTARAADEKAPKPRVIDIRPTESKAWGASADDVRAILVSAANELWGYFPDRPLKPILVEPNGGPITLFDRGPGGEYRVKLDTGDNLWAQWVFQFAHEFGHILSNYDEVSHQNKWFEETICEVSSLYVLHRLANTWSKDPSPGYWKKFAPALAKYADGRIVAAQLPKDMGLPQWYEANARHLAKTGYDRDKNTLVAVQLLPLFEKSPEHWVTIHYLAKAKKGHAETLPEFLKAWQLQCPEKHRAFVAQIAQKFAIDLEKVKLPPAKE